ncbi:hypothetical protein GO988_15975 [Hymenobacter sp. HMF4947]|uniref:Uncharacterized protein n=1 Tax=Hymenobacter ginkgonis TaxID=2682976 RepID=A0A7K1THB7_9BACT|nr:hypothetical protein [Hymenobacter ginkgonis]MVN77830.1 hypothetical protein [Hymenobacter ginkgonis]
MLTYYYAIVEGYQYVLVAYGKGPALPATSAESQLIDQFNRGRLTLDQITECLEFPALPSYPPRQRL